MELFSKVEEQEHLTRQGGAITGDNFKRMGILGGFNDRALVEKDLAKEYTLQQIVQAVVNRTLSKANAEALRARATYNVSRLEETREQKYKGGTSKARIYKLQVELVDMMKLKQAGKYSGRHKGETEEAQ